MKCSGGKSFWASQPLLLAAGIFASQAFYANRKQSAEKISTAPEVRNVYPAPEPQVAGGKENSKLDASPAELLIAAFYEGGLGYFELCDQLWALVNERIAQGDYDGALRIAALFPSRSYGLAALGSAIGENFEKLSSIEEKLMEFPSGDRQRICSSIMAKTSLPPAELAGIFAILPGKSAQERAWSSYLDRDASPTKLQQAIDHINTMPESPLRQRIITMALVRKDCQNGKEFTDSLSLIQGEAMRDRFVEEILVGTTRIRTTHEERLALIESIEDPAIRQYADDTYVRLFGPAHLRPLMTSEERYEVMLSLQKDNIVDSVLFRKEFEKRARELISSRDQSEQK